MWGTRLRAAAGPVAAAAAVVAATVLAVRHAPDVGAVQAAVREAGALAPVVFVALQVGLTLAPVPRTVFSVAAGVLFGAVTGLGIALLATGLSGAVAFLLVRLAGARFMARHADRAAVAWVRARVERRGLLAVLSLRLIPVVPFAVVNYAAGLSGVRFAPYLVGTVLGSLPGTTAVVVLGDAVLGGAPHPALLAVSVGCGLLGLAGAALAVRRPAPALPVA